MSIIKELIPEINWVAAEQRLVILPEEVKDFKTSSGILITKEILAEKANRAMWGIIVRAGEGSKDHPMKYRVGDKVLFSEFAGTELEFNLTGHGLHVYKVMNQLDVMLYERK